MPERHMEPVVGVFSCNASSICQNIKGKGTYNRRDARDKGCRSQCIAGQQLLTGNWRSLGGCEIG